MTRLIASELRKARTVRTIPTLLLLGVAFTAANIAILAFAAPEELGTRFAGSAADTRRALDAVGGNTVWILVIGILIVTTEFRHRTAGRTFLAEPSRSRVIAAKLVAVSLVALAFAVLAVAVAFGVLAIGAGVEGTAIAADAETWTTLWQAGVALVMNGLIGVAIGALLRSQVAAMVLTLVWVFAVENVLSFALPDLARYAPFQALQSIFADDAMAASMPFEPVEPAVALSIFLGYVVVFALGGVVLMARRDV